MILDIPDGSYSGTLSATGKDSGIRMADLAAQAGISIIDMANVANVGFPRRWWCGLA